MTRGLEPSTRDHGPIVFSPGLKTSGKNYINELTFVNEALCAESNLHSGLACAHRGSAVATELAASASQ